MTITNKQRVLDALDGRMLTRDEIGARTKLHTSSVSHAITRIKQDGDIHIAAWSRTVRGAFQAYWAKGPGVDAVRPGKTAAEFAAEKAEKRRIARETPRPALPLHWPAPLRSIWDAADRARAAA